MVGASSIHITVSRSTNTNTNTNTTTRYCQLIFANAPITRTKVKTVYAPDPPPGADPTALEERVTVEWNAEARAAARVARRSSRSSLVERSTHQASARRPAARH